jgi:hypothetical protein
MTRHRKTLEEQLAEVRAKKAQVAARLDQLEVRRKARDARLQALGEKVVVRVVLQAATLHVEFRRTLEGLIGDAALSAKEHEAALALLGSLAPSTAPESAMAAVASNGGFGANQD